MAQNSGTSKTVIKSELVRDLGFLMAIILLCFEGVWLSKYGLGKAEIFQTPVPDYQMKVSEIHLVRLLLCLVCLIGFFKPREIFWKIFKYIAFCYQCSVVAVTTVFQLRYGYGTGVGLLDTLMLLSGLPLLFIFLLMLSKSKGMSGMVVCLVVILDLIFSFCGDWFYQGVESFNLFFPYHGFLFKGVFSVMLVTFISCFGHLDADA